MHDMLRETPIYQETLKEGCEEGLEQGLDQGLQRGQLEALRQAIIDVVVERFPKLVRLTKKQVAVVEDTELLWHVLVKVSVAHTAEEAEQQLLALNEVDEQGIEVRKTRRSTLACSLTMTSSIANHLFGLWREVRPA